MAIFRGFVRQATSEVALPRTRLVLRRFCDVPAPKSFRYVRFLGRGIAGVEFLQNRRVKSPVGCQRVASVWTVFPSQRRKSPSGFRHDGHESCHIVERKFWLTGDIYGSLRKKTIGPEVSKPADSPNLVCEVKELIA